MAPPLSLQSKPSPFISHLIYLNRLLMSRPDSPNIQSRGVTAVVVSVKNVDIDT
ncbi:hypothetical protein Bpfe_029090, partial [Biomphalaria pfeifferi]